MFYLIRFFDFSKNIEFPSYKGTIFSSNIKETWRKKDAYVFGVLMQGGFHRNKGPAIIYKNGFKSWYHYAIEYRKNDTGYSIETLDAFDGVLPHSYSDNPSIVYNNGTKEWHKSGFLHRYEKPAIEYSNGDVEYWYYGQRHRKDGPAVIIGNKQYWFEKDNFVKLKVLK